MRQAYGDAPGSGYNRKMPEEIKTLDEHISAAEFDARLMRSNQEALARLEKDEARLRHLEALVAEKEALGRRHSTSANASTPRFVA
jgi:phage I-like protein